MSDVEPMDGDVLSDEHGVVCSRRGGFFCGVFRCKCGREQLARPPDDTNSRGITPALAERVGWRRIDGRWECPFCCGNEEILKRVFDNGDQT